MMSQPAGGGAAVVEKFAVAIYMVALLCMLAPPLDVIFSMPAMDVNSVRWRFGAIGLVTGAALLPLVGLVLALMTAVVCDHRWMHRVFMALGVVGAVSLTLALGLFVLDALQVRGDVAPQVVRRFDLTVIKSVLTQVAQLVALTVVLWNAVRARRVVRRSTAAAGPGLVMAAPRQAAPH